MVIPVAVVPVSKTAFTIIGKISFVTIGQIRCWPPTVMTATLPALPKT